MREQGGTLFSTVIDRHKLNLKIAGPEPSERNGEGKKRLSNETNLHASYGGGTKTMINGSSLLLPTASQNGMHQRFKGGHGGSLLMNGKRQNGTEIHDYHEFSTMERFKELRAKLEPLLRQKISPAYPIPPPAPSPPEESVSLAPPLPQWGHVKRARRSRFDAPKPCVTSPPEKPLHRSGNDSACVVTTHVKPCSVPGRMEYDANTKGSAEVATSRNAAGNGVCANSYAALRPKGESIHSVRQSSDESAEPTASNRNGHMARTTHGSRPAPVPETITTAHLVQVKPRAELKTLEWPRIVLGLSRKEKEDDFLILKGTKLPQRPKKRPKAVERALHYCTPGNGLCDMYRGRYDVREKKTVRKRPRGLKAMESMESDSE
ncbi:hypothetical protein KP509_20G031800 [Ceratopteris richardii]|uniref:Uncharacterized protein n=1 Tax=Ceratopteris richardii TaxID=49495 RepID=A0A8T2SHI0_CERRI|nr:hypothetical protein KP509_20G031800 [Ceratopteris richardii]